MLRRNVLIFHLGALGDFILTWPFAIALGRIYPQSRIIYITHGQKGALAERVLRLESNDVENGWHAMFGEGAMLPLRAAEIVTGAHAIYSFLSPTPAWMQNVRLLNPQSKLVSLEPRPPESFTGHAAEWIAGQLCDHPVEKAATEQMLRSIADRGIGFHRSGGTDVVIHPGSGSPGKCWPVENFAQLAGRLGQSGRKVRVLLGEVEQERWTHETIESLSSVAEIRRPRTYLELLSELSTAGLFVGNDSGPGHLAGIIGLPTVSIFGSTDPARWKPLGPRVHVAGGKSAAWVSVDEVFRTAVDAMANDKGHRG